MPRALLEEEEEEEEKKKKKNVKYPLLLSDFNET